LRTTTRVEKKIALNCDHLEANVDADPLHAKNGAEQLQMGNETFYPAEILLLFEKSL